MSLPTSALVFEDQAETREHLLAALAEAFPGVVARGARRPAPRRARSWTAACRTWRWSIWPCRTAGASISCADLNERSGGTTRSVVVTIYADDAHLFDAIAAGAGGYLLKDMGRRGPGALPAPPGSRRDPAVAGRGAAHARLFPRQAPRPSSTSSPKPP
jgi:hypothetical protein